MTTLDEFKELLQRAKDGDAEAQWKVGLYYERGIFTGTNSATAFWWYKKAAENNSAEGWFQMGWCYKLGIGNPVDDTKALRCFREAEKRGHPTAKKYAYPELPKQDTVEPAGASEKKTDNKFHERLNAHLIDEDKKAFEYYLRAAVQGDYESALGVVRCYASEESHDPRLRCVVEILEKQECKTAECMRALAACYYKGIGCNRDMLKVVAWERQAQQADRDPSERTASAQTQQVNASDLPDPRKGASAEKEKKDKKRLLVVRSSIALKENEKKNGEAKLKGINDEINWLKKEIANIYQNHFEILLRNGKIEEEVASLEKSLSSEKSLNDEELRKITDDCEKLESNKTLLVQLLRMMEIGVNVAPKDELLSTERCPRNPAAMVLDPNATDWNLFAGEKNRGLNAYLLFDPERIRIFLGRDTCFSADYLDIGKAYAHLLGNTIIKKCVVSPRWFEFKDFWTDALREVWESAYQAPSTWHVLLVENFNVALPECWGKPLWDLIDGRISNLPCAKNPQLPQNLKIIVIPAGDDQNGVSQGLRTSVNSGWEKLTLNAPFRWDERKQEVFKNLNEAFSINVPNN